MELKKCEFILMNKDEPLAVLGVQSNIAYLKEELRRLPGFLKNINEWINNRTSPFGRNNINILLKYGNINNKVDFLFKIKGISLNDTLWINNTYSSTEWSKVNPYRNRLSRIISLVALDCNYIGGRLDSPSPEYRLDGVTDKCWKRINGKIYLYKTDVEGYSGVVGNRPYCEYYASQVARALGLSSYVRYNIKVRNTQEGFKKAYVISEIFTNEDFGFMPIGNTKYRYNSIEELDRLLVQSDSSRLILRETLILDSITLNFDRHTGNYGFLIDNDNLSIKGMAPVFDNDCSLGPFTSLQNRTIKDAYKELIKTRGPCTYVNGGGYINQARWAMTDDIKQRIKNIYPFKLTRIGGDNDITDDRVNFMEFIINSQIKSILQVV